MSRVAKCVSPHFRGSDVRHFSVELMFRSGAPHAAQMLQREFKGMHCQSFGELPVKRIFMSASCDAGRRVHEINMFGPSSSQESLLGIVNSLIVLVRKMLDRLNRLDR